MSDLDAAEQDKTRAALAHIHARCGSWVNTGKVLHFQARSLARILAKQKDATVVLALRLARVAGVGVDDVLSGRFPPANVCPHCGREGTAANDHT